jgi:hypothetical protein
VKVEFQDVLPMTAAPKGVRHARQGEHVGAFDEGQRVRERYLETTYGVRVVFLVECIRASVYLS